MHWRVLFRKAWLHDRFSTCLNLVTLLRCCSGLQLLTHFLFGIHECFWMNKNSKCLMWQILTVFFWWLVLACNAFYFKLQYNRFAHIKFYTQSKRLLLLYTVPFTPGAQPGGRAFGAFPPPEIFKTFHSNFDIYRNFQRIKMKFYILTIFKKFYWNFSFFFVLLVNYLLTRFILRQVIWSKIL